MRASFARRALSAAVSVVLVMGMCPSLAFAGEDEGGSEQAVAGMGDRAVGSGAAAGGLAAASLDSRPGLQALEPTAAAKATNAAKYSYSAKPIISPLSWSIYVKTNNPDPTSFRLVDKSSKYVNKGEEPAAYTILDSTYLDVKYEKVKTHRVKGGYIFYCSNGSSDGGALKVQQKRADGSYADTGKTVKLPVLKTGFDYLMDTYAKGSTFFEKLNGVEAGLYALSVYPRAVYDSKKRNTKNGWPCLAASPYPELGLNDHYESLYERSDKGLFLKAINPFVLDSLGFPNTMASAARALNPNCEISRGSEHWLIQVTLNGETHYYGWAGEGGSGPLYSNTVNSFFTFNGGNSDLAFNSTLKDIGNCYLGYLKESDKQLEKYRDMVQGKTFYKSIGKGTWARIAVEGGGGAYAYILGNEDSSYAHAVGDAWVEGRYVNQWECLEMGTELSDHPQSDVIVRNKTFKDANGTTHTCDVRYRYDVSTATWRAGGYGYEYADIPLPSELVLTKAQVQKMIKENSRHIPAAGKVYDGTKKPGTAFKNTLVTGVSVPKSAVAYVQGETKLRATVAPTGATHKSVSWVSQDPKIATVTSDGAVVGVKAGKVKLVATTVDGAYSATCTVTVKTPTNIKRAAIGKIAGKRWNGKEVTPKPVVKYGGKKLVLGKDYTVSYSGNYGIGTASVIVTGINAFKGTKSKEFKIWGVAKKPKVKNYTYNGRYRQGVVGGEGFWVDGSSWATYPGTYTATLKLNDGYLWANGSRKSVKVTWRIKPKRVSAPKAKSFTYNGKKRTGVKTGKGYSVWGTTSAKKPGVHTAYASPDYGYAWKNGKTNTIELKWKIKRR